MSTTLSPVITQAGITALIDARNRGMQARITHVAVGDGQAGAGSGPYIASDDMTALRHEIQRAIVSGGEQIGSGQNQLHLTAALQDEGSNVPDVYPIYEIGFFLETGELFAVYASPQEKLAEKVIGTDFLLAFDLTLTGADVGDIVIDGRGPLETPAARDNILLGYNTVKIHTQAEFDSVFNRGEDTVIAANHTIALSPIQDTYQPNDRGRWQRVREITAFANSSSESGNQEQPRVTCTSVAHGLSDGDSIVILQSQHHNGNYSVSNVTVNSFDILASFVVTGTAKWGSLDGSAYTAITDFADASANPGTDTACNSAAHGLSAGDSILITQSRYYSGVYTLVTASADNFDIATPFITGDLADGAWGGKGDDPENTYNGRPAYILKNSIVLSENVSIFGFNVQDTLVIKDSAATQIKALGTASAPVTGICLHGWSFDGRGGIDGLGGNLAATTDGGGFYLDYCEHSEINCKIINHATSANGGGLYGANGVNRITATGLHHNSAANGGGAYNCDNAVLAVYDCSASANGSGVHSCDNAQLTLSNCQAFASNGGGVVVDNAKVGINTTTPAAALSINGGLHVGGDSDPGDNNLLVDGTATITGAATFNGDINLSQTRKLSFGTSTRQMIDLFTEEFGIGVQSRTQYYRTIDDFAWFKGGTHSTSRLDPGTGGTVQMVINSNGRVGVGTNNPSHVLHANVAGGGASILRLDSDISDNADVTQGIHLFKNFNGSLFGWQIEGSGLNNSTADLKFISSQAGNNVARVTIMRDNGNVGIGTINPAARLSINGGLHVGGDSDPGDNNLLVDGTATFNGNVTLGNSRRINTDEIRARDSGGLRLYSDGGSGIFIHDRGRVGIGTSAPQFPLHIEGSVGRTSSNYGAYNNSGSGQRIAGPLTPPLSIFASDRVGAAEFNAFSDSRIKQIISISDPISDLAKLLALKVTDYRYIDTIERGDAEKKGLIAQQVEAVFPQAVQQNTGCIPDIFTLCTDLDYRADQSHLVIRLSKPHALAVGDKVRLIVDEQGQLEKDVVAIEDDHTFTVSDWDKPVEKIFVYGKKVDDFRTIDYDRILMLCISAVQAHQDHVQQLEQEKSTLQQRVERLEQGYNELKAQVDRLLPKA